MKSKSDHGTRSEVEESVQMSEILDWLHTTAQRNLFGNGSWPADDETNRKYWFIFKRYLSITVTGDAWLLTKEAVDIDVVSFAAFIGVDSETGLTAFDWDEAAEAERADLVDQLWDADEATANELTKQYLRGAYVRYCALHKVNTLRQKVSGHRRLFSGINRDKLN
jgi:hypothetical protein